MEAQSFSNRSGEGGAHGPPGYTCGPPYKTVFAPSARGERSKLSWMQRHSLETGGREPPGALGGVVYGREDSNREDYILSTYQSSR